MSARRDFTAVRGDRAGGWLGQTRSEVVARNGIVTTSQPLAAQAGLQILKQGGNAFDAAVAAAAVLNVVEPAGAGLGGDAFVLAWIAREGKLIALNGSGRAPCGATPERFAQRGHVKQMPHRGIDAVTMPGAVEDWRREVDVLRSDPDSARVYLVEGGAPALYSTFRNPELARALRVLQTGGP